MEFIRDLFERDISFLPVQLIGWKDGQHPDGLTTSLRPANSEQSRVEEFAVTQQAREWTHSTETVEMRQTFPSLERKSAVIAGVWSLDRTKGL